MKKYPKSFFSKLFFFLFLLKVLKTRGNVFDSMASEKTFQLTGATTFGITTLGITTFGVTTPDIMALSIVEL